MTSRTTEPFAWAVEISGTDKIFSSQKAAENARRRYEKVFDAERMEPFPIYRHPAPLSPDHSGGAGKVVLPDRNTIYVTKPIVMDGTELIQVWQACLDKVKELNQ